LRKLTQNPMRGICEKRKNINNSNGLGSTSELKSLACHAGGRGFESLRPRQIFQGLADTVNPFFIAL